MTIECDVCKNFPSRASRAEQEKFVAAQVQAGNYKMEGDCDLTCLHCGHCGVWHAEATPESAF